jgi:midasin
MIFKQDLHALNCHATTETSDLIGGLRPVRGRDSIAYDILRKVKELYRIWPFQDMLETVELPGTVAELINEGAANNDVHSRGIGADSVATLVKFSKSIINAKPHQEEQFSQEREAKRLKKSPECEDKFTAMDSLISLYKEIESLGKSYTALFEWSDGPLVKAMKSGDMMLLDEMSLAEDAVLERLNSVLEPSRTLVLAEKGDDGNVEEEESRVILAHESFRIFATMNPGGDFGKRELSPALRSRFTEIWVPAITERRDFDLVLSRCFESISDDNAAVRKRMLDYVFWFNETIAGDSQGPCSGLTLTLRDILSWAKFIIHSQCAENPMGKWDAFCHGACLMHLDGLGLGAGLSLQDAAEAQAKAEDYLKQSVPTDESLSYFHQKVDIAGDGDARRLGCEPFFISYGPFDVEDASFDMSSPTTSLNMYRVLRAMYLERPIILEGPPGVGKTR